MGEEDTEEKEPREEERPKKKPGRKLKEEKIYTRNNLPLYHTYVLTVKDKTERNQTLEIFHELLRRAGRSLVYNRKVLSEERSQNISVVRSIWNLYWEVPPFPFYGEGFKPSGIIYLLADMNGEEKEVFKRKFRLEEHPPGYFFEAFSSPFSTPKTLEEKIEAGSTSGTSGSNKSPG